MKECAAIAKLPDVIGAVLSDHSGTLLDWSGMVDGETAGAVHAFTARGFTQAGDTLGIGSLQRMSIVGPSKTCVIALQSDTILGLYGEPNKPVGLVERRLQDALSK
jgi:hypothetical protein